MSRFLKDFIYKANELTAQGVNFVAVTLIQPEGHVPQDIGAKALITEEGIVWGTVGGGRLEAEAIRFSQEMLRKAKETLANEVTRPEMKRYDLQKDLSMVCGGAATLFYEVAIPKTWNIVVFGAGHVAQAVVPLIATFDCQVWCVDHRQEWLTKMPTQANIRKVCVPDLPSYVSHLPEKSFYLCVTQGHATDLPVVREILKRGDAGFLGVIGSVQKAKTLKNKLQEEGFSKEQIDTIHCPVGLPIGTNAPSEIAVSIASQLLQKRDEK